jgi:hypothetical protein
MESSYKNKNRGYQQLRVWQDAIDLYVLTCRIFRTFPFELNLIIKESNVAYGGDGDAPMHHSSTPPLHHSITPSPHHPITPPLH